MICAIVVKNKASLLFTKYMGKEDGEDNKKKLLQNQLLDFMQNYVSLSNFQSSAFFFKTGL